MRDEKRLSRPQLEYKASVIYEALEGHSHSIGCDAWNCASLEVVDKSRNKIPSPAGWKRKSPPIFPLTDMVSPRGNRTFVPSLAPPELAGISLFLARAYLPFSTSRTSPLLYLATVSPFLPRDRLPFFYLSRVSHLPPCAYLPFSASRASPLKKGTNRMLEKTSYRLS